jgi:Tfp pilus assembly protein PilN
VNARVNLLPREVEARNRAARQRAGLAGAGVLFLAILVALYLFQVGRVNDTQARLEAEQAELSALQADLATLTEFQDLERRRDEANELLATALGGEASVAGVLQDLAAVFPTDADLTSLAVTVTGEPGAAALGAERPSYGQLTGSGRTTRGHAPGLERLLLELEKVGAFSDVYFGSSTLDEEGGFATFSIDVQLGPEILTRRYANGLPEELR